MDITKIKLVIWDLDETFWKGTLSDNTAEIIEDNVQLIRNLVDAGVMCSICSKNDEQQVKNFLQPYNIWDYFVFVSINWTPKGERIKQIINEMALREQNVLFIDDNTTNLAEARDVCCNIMAERETIVQELSAYFNNVDKTDKLHTRLQQYKVLERKRKFKAALGSNEDFLLKCNIHVDIKYDCLTHVDRIENLIQRSNQLNFTKVRSSKDEIISLLKDNQVRSGYVEVKDSFGDYGIVGFFAIKYNKCIHLAFSCRILNMGVEQYVFRQIGTPELTIIGEVSSRLDEPEPYWINQGEAIQREARQELKDRGGKLLIKGPCDMSQMFSFIRDNKKIIKEFTYVGRDGVTIEQRNHTVHVMESLTLAEETKNRLIDELPFGDKDMFNTAMFNEDVDFILFSMFTDPNLGLYREKQSGALVAFGEYVNDLTDEMMWSKFINKEVFVATCDFTEENLRFIKEHFDFIGRLSPDEIVSNLNFIYHHLSGRTKLILNLGSEIEYLNNKQKAYQDRHIYNKILNEKIRKWSEDKNQVSIIDVNDYIKGQESFGNNINHFSKNVYYEMSGALIKIIDGNQHSSFIRKSKFERTMDWIQIKVRRIPGKLKRMMEMRK